MSTSRHNILLSPYFSLIRLALTINKSTLEFLPRVFTLLYYYLLSYCLVIYSCRLLNDRYPHSVAMVRKVWSIHCITKLSYKVFSSPKFVLSMLEESIFFCPTPLSEKNAKDRDLAPKTIKYTETTLTLINDLYLKWHNFIVFVFILGSIYIIYCWQATIDCNRWFWNLYLLVPQSQNKKKK